MIVLLEYFGNSVINAQPPLMNVGGWSPSTPYISALVITDEYFHSWIIEGT